MVGKHRVDTSAGLAASRIGPTRWGRRMHDGVCREGDAAEVLKAEEGRVIGQWRSWMISLHYQGLPQYHFYRGKGGSVELRSGLME